MNKEQLFDLRVEIDRRLGSEVGDLDLNNEIKFQYISAKTLMADTLDDDDVEPQKKASVINACTSILNQLTKSQSEIYSIERVKKIESVIIEVLRQTSPDLVLEFLSAYEQSLG